MNAKANAQNFIEKMWRQFHLRLKELIVWCHEKMLENLDRNFFFFHVRLHQDQDIGFLATNCWSFLLIGNDGNWWMRSKMAMLASLKHRPCINLSDQDWIVCLHSSVTNYQMNFQLSSNFPCSSIFYRKPCALPYERWLRSIIGIL